MNNGVYGVTVARGLSSFQLTTFTFNIPPGGGGVFESDAFITLCWLYDRCVNSSSGI